MIWIIIQLIFPLLIVAIPWLLYRNHCLLLAQGLCMVQGFEKGFKFLVQILMIVALSFHFVYSCAFKDFGIMLSTLIVVLLYRQRWAEVILRWLGKHQKAYFLIAFSTVLIAIVPHLYTLAVTIDLILVAAIFCTPIEKLPFDKP